MRPGPSSRTSIGNIHRTAIFVVPLFVHIMFLYYHSLIKWITCNIIFSTIRLHLLVGSMCALSLSSPSAFRCTANTKNSRAMLLLTISRCVHKSRHQFHVLAALVSVYVQCTLIWKYIKCMRILNRILFACYYVISTIFGMKLTAR